MHADDTVLLLFTTCPDQDSAARIARQLVEERLAACVTRLGTATSTYVWDGAVHEDAEVQLLIKTTRATLPATMARLRALHPYELPEMIAVPVESGLPDYLDWIRAQTREERC